MGHLSGTTSNFLLLAFLIIAGQTFIFQSKASAQEDFQKTVSESHIIRPLAIANDHRGSGR